MINFLYEYWSQKHNKINYKISLNTKDFGNVNREAKFLYNAVYICRETNTQTTHMFIYELAKYILLYRTRFRKFQYLLTKHFVKHQQFSPPNRTLELFVQKGIS